MGQIRGRSRTWRTARGASRFRTLPVSLPLINRPGGGQGPELREERACSCPICSRGSGYPQALQPDKEPDPGTRAPARAHFGLVESWRLGHGAKRALRRCSLCRKKIGGPRWVDGRSGLRGPAVTAARHAPLNGARPRPRRSGPAPSPPPCRSPRPSPPHRLARCAFPGIPAAQGRQTRVPSEPWPAPCLWPGTLGRSHLWAHTPAAWPGSVPARSLLQGYTTAWAPTCARPQLETGKSVRFTDFMGLALYRTRHTLIAESHNRNV